MQKKFRRNCSPPFRIYFSAFSGRHLFFRRLSLGLKRNYPRSYSAARRRRTFMSSKDGRLWSRAWRGAKIIFFVANMLASLFLVYAPPLFVILLDLLLPLALLAAADDGRTFSVPALASQLKNYQYRTSLVDLPLLSATRSALILCFYLCGGGRWTYLCVTTLCASASAGFVSMKAISMAGGASVPGKRHLLSFGEEEGPAVEALFLSSLALAIAHVVAAYRTSCRERRKLLVCKIDIEAVKQQQVQAARRKGWSFSHLH